MAEANIQRVLKNCYITTGKKIQKRPCLSRVTTLESGTIGLIAAGGKLNTFYGPGALITHANTLFRANRVAHPENGALTAVHAHYGENFNRFLYVAIEYNDGSVKHHYLDDPGVWVTATSYTMGDFRRPTVENGFRYEMTGGADPGAWAAATAYAVGVFRRPTVANGLRYEVTAIVGTGTSGAAEPVWPTTIGLTVIDNPGGNQITWTCRALIGTSAGAEPAWPTVIGGTVVDNTVTWTASSFAIVDANCPNSKILAKLQQKIYAADEGDVAFCKTGDPRDWTAASDAGFIPSSINAAGSDTVTALGDYQGDLAIFFSDSTQVWDVDSDPALNTLKATAENIGTIHSKSPQAFANDLSFLSKAGIRSITVSVLTESLQESDVGSAIDALRSEIADADDARAIFYPGLGQLWLINGSKSYVLSYSKTKKIAGWSTFEFPITITDATILNNELYLRSGNVIYKADSTAFNDDGVAPLCEVEMYYQDEKTPGILKQFSGFDLVTKGAAEVAFRYDPRNPSAQTTYLSLSGGRTEPIYFLSLPGIAGNYASTPDSAANSVTGDIDIRVKLAADDWTPTAAQIPISKWANAGSQGSWILFLNTGASLSLYGTADGSTQYNADSTAIVSASDGATKWIRATREVSSGDMKFYTSDDGVAWSQLGATVTVSAGSGFFDSSAAVNISGYNSGADFPFAGKIYRAQVFNGINGIKVVDFEPRLIDKNTLKGVMWTEERWTVNQSGASPATVGFTNEPVTDPHQTLVGDTRPGDLLPLEIQATAIAPIFRHQADEDFGVELVQAYYENLAPV